MKFEKSPKEKAQAGVHVHTWKKSVWATHELSINKKKNFCDFFFKNMMWTLKLIWHSSDFLARIIWHLNSNLKAMSTQTPGKDIQRALKEMYRVPNKR